MGRLQAAPTTAETSVLTHPADLTHQAYLT